MNDNRLNPAGIDAQLRAIAARYTEETYWQRIRRMYVGLREPRQSREYKAAMIELQRLTAPLTAILVPAMAIMLLAVLTSGNDGNDRSFETEIMEMETLKDLEDIEREKPPDPPDIEIDIVVDNPNVDMPNPDQQPMISPQPQLVDAVMITKSPVILKGIFGDRSNTGTRGSLLGKYGGNAQTEAAVLRALRWLKLNQRPDGSWGTSRNAMTGLAILTFLAHGEKPGESEEFGPTVQKALEYLLSKQQADGLFSDRGGRDSHDYSHPIATYALAEAYGMTLNPNVKTAVEKALVPIIKGQNASGGWDYNMKPNPERDDTSYMGWCAQALKAAKLARVQADGLDAASKLAVRGFKKNAGPSGGFSYTSPGADGMTAVGALCLQLLGAGGDREVKLSLDLMKAWKPTFDETEPNARGHCTKSPQYYYYYATQAKFHAGDKAQWDKWNGEMSTLYVKEQKIKKNAIKDMKGKDQDVGWWENKDEFTDDSSRAMPVMDTCLAALQLMVYYRYLPTTSVDAVKVEEELLVSPTETGDITIDVDL